MPAAINYQEELLKTLIFGVGLGALGWVATRLFMRFLRSTAGATLARRLRPILRRLGLVIPYTVEQLFDERPDLDRIRELVRDKIIRDTVKLFTISEQVEVVVDSDGTTAVTYRLEIANVGRDGDMSEIERYVYLQDTDADSLSISYEVEDDLRHVDMERHQDRGPREQAILTFDFSPPLKPGDITVLTYTCTGGVLTLPYYWHQEFKRHAGEYRLDVKHREMRINKYDATRIDADRVETSIRSATISKPTEHPPAACFELVQQLLHPQEAVRLAWEAAS